MRGEIKSWWDQSKYDMETAEYLYDGGRYGAAAFSLQQSVEKALKALYLLKVKKSLAPTHSLLFLARESKVPKEHYRFLKALTPEFVVSRYPDAGGEAAYKYYDKELLDDYFKNVEILVKWIRSQIERP
jgi:HEPN domain-containing protein